jgi:hypothetical protein
MNQEIEKHRNRQELIAEMMRLREHAENASNHLLGKGEGIRALHFDAFTPLPELPLPFNQFILGNNLNWSERIAVALALAPTLLPEVLKPLMRNHDDGYAILQFGGVVSGTFRGFMPTMETLYFLLSWGDPLARLVAVDTFSQDHPLFANGLLRMELVHHNEPMGAALLLPTRELLQLVTKGEYGQPEFGPSFPAERISTQRDWRDLVLAAETLQELQDIQEWIRHEHTVMKVWKMEDLLAPGYRCLFHGPPGTGKTFTATLIGKATGKEVYRIDLSMVVSKYIGETEKNLKSVFDKAQSRGWILFFDEADALFGKRTDVSDSKDRYANQEVSYLLQRVEQFDGVVILATNNRDNMDKAFSRRFQVIVNFMMPGPQERLTIWQSALPANHSLSPGTDLAAIAQRYELSGGGIMNAVRHCSLRAAQRGDLSIHGSDILEGIRIEYKKAGRILN